MATPKSENLCVKWQDFQYNTAITFRSLRDNPDFADVTLVSEDNKKIKAHRVILASSSPIIKSMFDEINHSHPLVYMRGIKFKELSYIVDFIYHGETNIGQDDLQGFMGLAQEFKVKGLETNNLPEELQPINTFKTPRPNKKPKSKYEKDQGQDSVDPLEFKMPVKVEYEKPTDIGVFENKTFPNDDTIIIQTDTEISELKKKINAMIEPSQGCPTCKVCGHTTAKKKKVYLVSHIESKHMNVGFPCVQCLNSKMYNSRRNLSQHIAYKHNNGAFK